MKIKEQMSFREKVQERERSILAWLAVALSTTQTLPYALGWRETQQDATAGDYTKPILATPYQATSEVLLAYQSTGQTDPGVKPILITKLLTHKNDSGFG